MISRANKKFWKCFQALDNEIQAKSKEAYAVFLNDPWHPGLHFKRVHSALPIYSVRITKNYRAVGILSGEVIIWFWIGSHSDYEILLKKI
ncbi:ParE family toxin-like protein [Desulfonatronum thioautotrophicum]|uniref:ParE family toxin-like protein n=1 Tax=Desulfonatronum thioautotrophicum TaxID=617001 RepID=UPI0005EBCFCE